MDEAAMKVFAQRLVALDPQSISFLFSVEDTCEFAAASLPKQDAEPPPPIASNGLEGDDNWSQITDNWSQITDNWSDSSLVSAAFAGERVE